MHTTYHLPNQLTCPQAVLKKFYDCIGGDKEQGLSLSYLLGKLMSYDEKYPQYKSSIGLREGWLDRGSGRKNQQIN